MDYQIESMINDGHLEKLLDFARDYAIRIGDMLGNYRLVLAQWEENEPDLLRKLLTLTWDRLDSETRHRFINLMVGMVHRVSKSIIWQKGTPTGEPIIIPFNFQGDEIDLDRTLESIIANRIVSYGGNHGGCIGIHAWIEPFYCSHSRDISCNESEL
jgi:hypothetical protein